MPTTRLARRLPGSLTPFFPAPLFSAADFPSLTQALNEMNARSNEFMQTAFPEFPAIATGEKFPALNVSESKEEFTVSAELPGMGIKDVTVEYVDGVLSIRGEKEMEEKKEEEGRKYYMWERRFGSFQRALPFPGGIAEFKISAAFKDGLLTVHLPKAEDGKAKHQPIKITEG
jgi:HSP20 family protein